MATGADSYLWSLEVLTRQLTGSYRKPLDEYHPTVLAALINHLPDALKRESARRAMETSLDDLPETGDPEWDEMQRALRAGVDPATLPSWQPDGGGDNVRRG